MDNKPIIAVYDADFIPFYVCHNKKDELIKSLQDCLDHCDDLINNVNKKLESWYYLGFLTVGKCFRYEVYPEYKANRKYIDLPDYTKEVREHLMNVHNFKGQERYEADDLVVSYKKQNKDVESIIVSPDKDILNLSGRHFNPRKMEFVETSDLQASEYFWSSMVIGDGADNIKGVKGAGKKAAETMIVNTGLTGTEKHSYVLDMYITNYGEYEGIKEFTKNYLTLKIIDNVVLEDIKLNEVNNKVSE